MAKERKVSGIESNICGIILIAFMVVAVYCYLFQ